MVKVAFTGSFDPPHIGHKYVVDTAKSLGFDVVVIVANNVEKKYVNSLNSRVENAYAFFKTYSVGSDSDNIGDLIKSLGCSAIVRGVRNESDFTYEQEVADFNRIVNGLNTIYVPCPPEIRGVSSTSIRNLK